MSYSFTFAVGSPVIVRGSWPALVQSAPGVVIDGDAVWWVRPLSGNRLFRVKESELRAMTATDITCNAAPCTHGG